jgi:hypothetical protein
LTGGSAGKQTDLDDDLGASERVALFNIAEIESFLLSVVPEDLSFSIPKSKSPASGKHATRDELAK